MLHAYLDILTAKNMQLMKRLNS